MKEFLSQPWPWYISGPLIGLMVPVLLLAGNKRFGISSSMKHICAACLPANIKLFNYDWKKHAWNLIFVLGVIAGGAIGVYLINDPNPVAISDATRADLIALGITDHSGYIPKQLMSFDNFGTWQPWVFLAGGGFLVGFGTRYANGCTSGHSIMGMSALHWTSLLATICFFIGGLIVTHFVYPLLLN